MKLMLQKLLFGGKARSKSRQYTIGGRVLVKETGTPVADVLIYVYWVNRDALRGKEQRWHEYLPENKVISLANTVSTNYAGSFSTTLNDQHSLGDRSAIALIAYPIKEGEYANRSIPLYKSVVPDYIDQTETYELRISEKIIQLVDLLPTKTELLDQVEKDNKEIIEWHDRDRKQRDNLIKELYSKAEEAFKNFTPTTVSPSVRSQNNFLENRDELKNALSLVRGKTLQKIKDNGIAKKRNITLPEEVIQDLGLDDTGEQVKKSFSEMNAILSTTKNSAEFELTSAVRTSEERKAHEDKIVQKIYEHYKSLFSNYYGRP